MDWINLAVAAGLIVLCLIAFGRPAFAAEQFWVLVSTAIVLLAAGAVAAALAGGKRSRNRT